MWAAPAYRKRFGDLQPDPPPAVMSMYHRQRFIAEVIRRYAASGKMTDTITPRTPSRHPYAAV
ncbi:hypothetical protein DLF61_02805 [Escherichia coli O157]|nr:hypothetical protein [Escherichia coli O157]EFO1905245.1 hypothetical protein [Escherichia coli]EFO1908459.1 hypothetical protein [Escherichia coli O157]